MNELKKITIPLLLIILAGVFLLVSFMVDLYGGKSAKWVSRKMRLGGLLLSLTATLNACDPAQTAALIDTNPPWTCYIPAFPGDQKPQNVFYLESANDSLITLDLLLNNRIKGEIRDRTYDIFSFAVFDSQDSAMQRDNIIASDGVFDENTEQFEIDILKSLKRGDYIIRFFMADKDSQPEWSEQYFNLRLN